MKQTTAESLISSQTPEKTNSCSSSSSSSMFYHVTDETLWTDKYSSDTLVSYLVVQIIFTNNTRTHERTEVVITAFIPPVDWMYWFINWTVLVLITDTSLDFFSYFYYYYYYYHRLCFYNIFWLCFVSFLHVKSDKHSSWRWISSFPQKFPGNSIKFTEKTKTTDVIHEQLLHTDLILTDEQINVFSFPKIF